MVDKSEFKKFVDAGYKNKREANEINGYILDKELSTRRDKIYVHPKTGKVKHVIAGTDKLKDWTNNLLIPLGLHHHTNRYKNSEKIQKQANEKYGKQNVDLITHSQSGNIAENLAKRGLVGGENTSLNPAIIGEHNKNLKVVKSGFDPVSLLTKTNENDLILDPSSFNPVTEHSSKILGKGYKKKGDNINNMNLNHLREQDLIDRMAKLSHDMHLHHKTHGIKPSLLKGYKILGEGLKHDMSGNGLFAADGDTFNNWMKKSGDAFKSIQPYAEAVWEEVKNFGKGEDKVHQEYLAKKKEQSEQKEQSEKNQEVIQKLEAKSKNKVNTKKNKPKKLKEDNENYEVPTATLIEDDEPKDTFNKMYKPAVKQPVTIAHEINHYENEPINKSPTLQKYTNSFSNMPSSYDRSWQAQYGRGVRGSGFFDDLGNQIRHGFEDFGGKVKSVADVGLDERKRNEFGDILTKKVPDIVMKNAIIPIKNTGEQIVGNGFFDDLGNLIKHKGTYYGKKTAKLLNNEGIPYASGLLGEAAGEYFGVPPPLAKLAGTYAGKRVARHINRNTELGGYGIKRKGRMVKGSPEAKAWAEKMRLARSKGKGF